MALLLLLPPCIFSSFILAPETAGTPESLSSPGSVTFWREAGGGLHLLPPGDTWVKPGQGNVTLMCLANRRVEQCSWTTPYGKVYFLKEGLQAEGGRLSHSGSAEGECGVTLHTLKTSDRGVWTCNLGVVQKNEVVTVSGTSRLSEASPPSSHLLTPPFSQPTSNLSLGLPYKVPCTAAGAQPRPSFSWFLDDREIEGANTTEEENEGDFTQSLLFKPYIGSENSSITCRIRHPGLRGTMQASTRIQLTSTTANALMSLNPITSLNFNLMQFSIFGVAAFLLGAFLGVVGVGWLKRRKAVRQEEDDILEREKEFERNVATIQEVQNYKDDSYTLAVAGGVQGTRSERMNQGYLEDSKVYFEENRNRPEPHETDF